MRLGDSVQESLIEHVQSDGCVVYPTTTLPALGCLPTGEALDRLFELKRRDSLKVVSLAVADLAQAAQLVSIPDGVEELLSDFPAASLTLVMPAKQMMENRVGGDAIAIRVIAHPESQKLLRIVGPLTATSANFSGSEPQTDCHAAAKELGLSSKHVLAGACAGGMPSTLIRINDSAALTCGEQLQVLREGIIPTEEVKQWSMKPI